MSDLIERQVAIDAAIEAVDEWDGGCSPTRADMIADAINNTVPSAQTDLIAKIQNGINITNADDSYSCGMRNGMRCCMSLIDDKDPSYEDCPPAQKKGYTKADYVMALHKEYGCSLARAEEAHQKALEYLRNTSMMKG